MVYKVKCPCCGIGYIGKTDWALYGRTEEHAWTSTSSPVCNHLKTCQKFIDLFSLFSLSSDLFTGDSSVNNDITF